MWEYPANNGDSTVFASESNLNQNNQQENKECTDGSECGNTAGNSLNVVGGFIEPATSNNINQDNEQSNENVEDDSTCY